ncbi:MAG: Phosphoglycerate mutase [Candidatus Woesebacteria bacterium GW2011_GWB1_43_14]|uniref:Phosphoglycerate mutase n=1 Tax=Candidatus Woesebacteria bacterium GW2011_GWB1_43_14 TaxID=1618578 RepID=A0A0G1DGM1_9BACT|nr:MAG: Phosphoglycerate mutase [Candidatus Woesebacteria bacterium GW2011_GWC1_42_9]KKS97025.1 MAG: Phosphoglycerate mutase [Candidatus Woesebacteria bacterium GW2011_GWB1_43_14]
MSKELYLIRHGQTESNVNKLTIGHTDIGLTEHGTQEVRELALHLQSLNVLPSMIYSSPLLRARRTAEILQTTLGGSLCFDERLKEINYGDYEGSTRDVLWELEFGYHIEKMRAGNAETVQEVEKRISEFMESLIDNTETTLVVAHGMILSVFSQVLLGLDRSFSTVQALKNADYNYFSVEVNSERMLIVMRTQMNSLRGRLEFRR